MAILKKLRVSEVPVARRCKVASGSKTKTNYCEDALDEVKDKVVVLHAV